ncbi:protein TolR [Novosphingobium indicum]|uniref:Protein TolR n=1 Tax=Novosphingobium indicum TaxID=462949 RepID=A0ABQ2K0Y1_9SPHN|nr:protein TolR [Novosphingobium indicum]
MAEINVTPLVDVMLVLLIIFMVTAPLLKAAVPIDLPQSRAKALSEQVDEVTLSLSRDGTIYIDDAKVAQNELPDRLAALPRSNAGKSPLVTLRADRRLDYGQIMAIMGELNHAGFNAIALVTLAADDAPAGQIKGREP